MPEARTTSGVISPPRADLHTHSTVSDGLLSPTELVREAVRLGLSAIALTDHDTVDGLAEAEREAERLGVEFLPGLELSTRDSSGEIHLLGYGVDRDDPALLDTLREFANLRARRLDRMVEQLNASGIELDPERVRALAGGGTAGRPHVARALIEAGYVADTTEGFRRFLSPGQPGFVPRPKISTEDGINLVRAAGGVPTIAHPLEIPELEAVLGRLVPRGLLGLEAIYGEYGDRDRAALARVADRWELIATGGSDFHGHAFKAGRDLGGPPVPVAVVDRLRAAADSVRRTAPKTGSDRPRPSA